MVNNKQTKNAQIDVFELGTSGELGIFDYGRIVAHNVTKEQTVDIHDGSDKLAGVMVSGKEGVKFSSGDRAEIQFDGTAFVLMNDSLAPGDKVTSDASGRGILHSGSGEVVLGIALQASVPGQYISVRLNANSQ